MITVIGATGKTGQHVVAELVERGLAVRALVRNEQKAQELLPAGVEFVVGDLTDTGAVRRAVDGADKVYLATGDSLEQVQLELNVVDAAAEAGVRHLVKVSIGASTLDSPSILQRFHAAIEQRIAELGLPVTYLWPNWFSQNFLGAITADGSFYGSAGDGHIAPIDARDIAAVAVAALTDDSHIGAGYNLTGPESLTWAQIATRFSNALGREIRYVDLPDADFNAALIGVGLEPWYAEALVEFMGAIRADYLAEVSPVVDKILGRPARSFEDFARDYSASFNG